MNEESTNESINKKIHHYYIIFKRYDLNGQSPEQQQTNKQQRQSYFIFQNVGDNTDTNNFENEKYLQTPITK